MKSNYIRIAVLLGMFSIVGIIGFQFYWVNQSFGLAEKQFNQTVEIALYNVARKMAAFNGRELPNENPVRQQSSNYFIVDINDVIDASILDHFLMTEFEYSNIHIDYEYAIYDCDTDRMVFGNYIRHSEDPNANIKGTFQKFDEFTYYFGIIFPSKTVYILRSMNVWIISTFILITAIVFFTYAIFIILRQKRYSEVQRDFINNMTHEFKTPVSTIGISAKVLSEPEILENPMRLKNYAGIISDQNKRLETQIEKVLQLAKVEKNHPELNPEAVDLNVLIADVAKGFRLHLDDRNGKLELDPRASEPIVWADRFHLTNVIYNLIDNAMKYCARNPVIGISTVNDNGRLLLHVRDNGIGIEKKYHRRIYDKFFRIPTGNIHDVKGFGIGLNYVMNIVKNHKWKIELDSTPGSGSTFTITFPVKKSTHDQQAT
jgi:two-component system, OmpR family, phosphate regulon sensor histidine kinase PhoR